MVKSAKAVETQTQIKETGCLGNDFMSKVRPAQAQGSECGTLALM